MKKQHLFILSGLLALAVGVVLWLNANRHQDAQITKIGFVSPMTGPFEPYSKDILRGVQLAVDEANQQQGRFQLKIEDTKAEPKAALAAYKKLRSEGIRYLIGDLLSSSTLTIVPELNDDQVVLICPTGSDEQIAKGSKYAFSIYSSAKDEACYMADTIQPDERGGVAILYSSNPTAIDMARAARDRVGSNGVTVTLFEEIPKSFADYPSIVAKIMGSKQTMVFGFPNEIPTLMKSAAEKGVHTTWLLPSTMYDPGAAELLKDLTDKVEVTAPVMENEESVKDSHPGFVKYKAKYGVQPTIWAALGYDAATLITKNPAASADSFVKLIEGKQHKGVSGTISFMESRHARKTLRKVEIKNGLITE